MSIIGDNQFKLKCFIIKMTFKNILQKKSKKISLKFKFQKMNFGVRIVNIYILNIQQKA